MELGRVPCCCYCTAAAQAFFISRGEEKSIVYKEHFTQPERLFAKSSLLSISAVLFFPHPRWEEQILAFRVSLGRWGFYYLLISSSILFDTALSWFYNWNMGVWKSDKRGGHGVHGLQELQNQNPVKLDFKTYRKNKWKCENLPNRLIVGLGVFEQASWAGRWCWFKYFVMII